ncbi:hypothetical protein TTHERM_000446268 (macronuclear) [Tetrahymena thermophila SB210]|uniref:Uncharacterized protein n=1 Tax=Tetrahymena thermophila (strain SB210) TaxID=312017 RepID=W7XEN7_TETTS|nr:hypothetical protein TTHERM_000446268 [Tetrahymena thermophila SB210]EWS72351.1 hypothetical protein TTHERM_000446268 [Tetrahymena thermophila SB210]|eukprot:XP_012655128.1 hypothetical protein TTHERM_000446268 [Tetrahymena thermophila SB210]
MTNKAQKFKLSIFYFQQQNRQLDLYDNSFQCIQDFKATLKIMLVFFLKKNSNQLLLFIQLMHYFQVGIKIFYNKQLKKKIQYQHNQQQLAISKIFNKSQIKHLQLSLIKNKNGKLLHYIQAIKALRQQLRAKLKN